MSKVRYDAFQTIDTNRTDDNGKTITYWNKVGSAFVNQDGSINVILNAVPLDGKVQLRLPKEKE